mmetsp:Transcript_89320/g.198518  ORF Transcript_89320/g.198518 Transcript_89320/m.198518 type:complete len:376 (-) Transcript_89320:344-1471(-)
MQAGGKAGVQCGACGVSCDDGAACGGGGAGGCAAAGCGGGFDDTTVLSYVGTGQGEYVAETSYKYVGKGAGDIQMVEVPTRVGAAWCKWLITIPMILVILWLGLPMLSSDTTTTTQMTPKTCLVYGDPHVLSFDKAHADYYSSGEYWLVKSDTVWIQARYQPTPVTHGLAVTKEIAIGGPFLKGHKLFFDAKSSSVWFTGAAPQNILTSFPSSFHSADPLVDIQYNSQGKVLQKGRDGKPLHVLHITMPNGVNVQVNRWNEAGEGDYMNIELTMPGQPNQDGQCGTPNGNAADDDRMEVRKRLGTQGVAVGDLILPGAKTPIVVSNRPDISNCPTARLQMAEAACKKKEGKFIPSKQCLIDVCFGGKAFAAEDVM